MRLVDQVKSKIKNKKLLRKKYLDQKNIDKHYANYPMLKKAILTRDAGNEF